ncbi:hypothetical protein [Actinomadura rayongensis]|uniref:NYN domain-containing protein n=1 Tax=Actinomadura rayongensis TaxID=1429076 RepID=A0A6I4WDP3_9ACTN|nr:hypothetical protein [Actinomadura rayongensis]MXQ65966.1 hypothetical protein [Actinomadura rayongensis]
MLIDLENMLYERSRRVDDARAAKRIEAILDTAGPVQHTFVVGGQWAFIPHVALLAARSLPPFELVRPAPDSADRVLLDRGEFLASTGYTDFFIASRDRIFAPFASSYRTTVITPSRRGLSRALEDAAAEVIVLTCG